MALNVTNGAKAKWGKGEMGKGEMVKGEMGKGEMGKAESGTSTPFLKHLLGGGAGGAYAVKTTTIKN